MMPDGQKKFTVSVSIEGWVESRNWDKPIAEARVEGEKNKFKMSEQTKLRLFAWQPTIWISISLAWVYYFARLALDSHDIVPRYFALKGCGPLLICWVLLAVFWTRSPKRAEMQHLPRPELLLCTIAPLIVIGIAMFTLNRFFTTAMVGG